MVNSLLPFSQAQNTASLVSVTRQIRDCISHGLDDELWEELTPLLQAEGLNGSREYDHAEIAFKLRGHIKGLSNFDNLKPRKLYDHFVAVVKQRGFIMVRGYIVGHITDDLPEASEQLEETVNESMMG